MTILTTSRVAPTLFAALLALSGCGLKGPLYIPPPEPEPDTTAQPENGDEPAGAQTPETEIENENDG